jgi:hypothetical protein
VGQNSTQKPQALQRSTTIRTAPFATPSSNTCANYDRCGDRPGVTAITSVGEGKHRT